MGNRIAEIHSSLAKVTDPLLRESLCCLLTHFHPEWGDRWPFDVLNRLVAKNLGRAGPNKTGHSDLRVEQITSRKEQWTTSNLGKLTRGHTDPRGVDIACPIILAECAGRTIVLDGNHRINRWVDSNDERLHDVIIHRIDEPFGFVEHTPDAHGV